MYTHLDYPIFGVAARGSPLEHSWRTVIHESAHAVIAVLVGGKVASVFLGSDCTAGNQGEAWIDFDGVPTFEAAVVYAAGEEAARLWLHRYYEDVGGGSGDDEMIARLGVSVAEARRGAARLLTDPTVWAQVCSVANRLLGDGWLSSRAVSNAMAAVAQLGPPLRLARVEQQKPRPAGVAAAGGLGSAYKVWQAFDAALRG